MEAWIFGKHILLLLHGMESVCVCVSLGKKLIVAHACALLLLCFLRRSRSGILCRLLAYGVGEQCPCCCHVDKLGREGPGKN